MSPPQDTDTVEFPLEAYAPRVSPPQSSKQIRTSPSVTDADSTRQSIARSLCSSFFRCWVCYLIISDLTRVLCFGTFWPAVIAPPAALCTAVSPTVNQFWNRVFDPTTVEPSSYRHIAYVQSLLSLPRQWDFALRGAGAAVLPDYTSPTFTPSPKSRSAPAVVNRPSIILEEQVTVGDCWEFEGTKGRIGIHLPEKVNLTSVTVGYPGLQWLPPAVHKKAPRSLSIWALIDSQAMDPGPSSVIETRQPSELTLTGKSPQDVEPNLIFISVLRIFFKPDSFLPIQYFAVTDQFVTSDTIVIDVNGNWGGTTTCLHHIGVHGRRD